MAGAISLEDEGEGEDVDDPKYAKFSRGLENEVGALGYAYRERRRRRKRTRRVCLRVRCPPKSTQKPTQGPTPAPS